jgi:predicted double-glycine peptidase
MSATRRVPAIVLLAFAAVQLGSTASGILLDVPLVREPPDGCGAACLAMVLKYWKGHDPAFRCDRPDQVESIQQVLYSPQAHGILARDMIRYLTQSGMRPFAFSGRRADLAAELAEGRPLIVCLKEPGWHGPRHYVVVTGFTSSEQTVLFNDPARGKLTAVKWPKFKKNWGAAGFWTLLAVPRQTP